MPSVIAYGCDDATAQFHPMQIDIREPGEGEIYFGLRVKMCVWLGVSRGLDLAFLNAD